MTEEYLLKILKIANEKKATDIHLCAGTQPLFRINGKLTKMDTDEIVAYDMLNQLVEHIVPGDKYQILVKNRVLDFSLSRPSIGRYRCNIYSQRGSYAIALRVLPFDIPKFENLGLPESLKKITTKNKGLFLITGGTGSGKSTTLASLVDILNENNQCHIITIEDPIEYLHKHKEAYITQREIGSDALSFSDALRSSLREDPDVIMVGEMRDPETISIAITAAETGHLVLSTLHTIGAAKTIDRIIDSFPDKQQNQVKNQLATVLEGVVSQELVKRADGSGLCLATEVMYVNPAIKNLIREGKEYQINSILQTGQSSDMHLMEDSLAKLLKEGIISEEEAMYKAPDEQLLKQFMNRR
ncbi:MAG: type IV pilus twitching motility protein PilT [Lachnospirales bacterium]